MAVFGMGHVLFIAAVTMLYGFSLWAAGAGMILNTAIFQGKDTKAMIAVNHLLYYAAQYAIAICLKYLG